MIFPGFSEKGISLSEVSAPFQNLCASGHCAPLLFRREGPTGPEELTRFYEVRGEAIYGVYCEPCLIIANHLARLKRKEGGGFLECLKRKK